MRTPRRAAGVVALILIPLVAGGFVLQSRDSRDGVRLFDQVLSLVSQRFVDTLDAGALYERAARGLVSQLDDPYAALFTPKQSRDFNQATSGKYGGIGMQIEEIDGLVTVSHVFPHTPAENAGVQEGDRIVGIDTANARGWKNEQVSNTLKGTPGTTVTVRFARPGVTEAITVKFKRAIITIPAVAYAIMFDGRTGYVPVQQFNESATQETAEAIRNLTRQGAKAIVLDLRDNPGGILTEALSLSDLFLREGLAIASVRGRQGPAETFSSQRGTVMPDEVPLIVLTDGGSASASEIVAGALQDHDRALVVGTTSFGKGLVQTVFPLDGGYQLKLTTAKWYTPSGRSIQKDRKKAGAVSRLLPAAAQETGPDSTETDSVRKSRPVFRSDAGRIVYGGGGVTPDVIVPVDTLTTAEQNVNKLLLPKLQQVFQTLSSYALELKPTVRSDFTITPAMREEFHRRLTAAGVVMDRTQYAQAQRYLDRLLEARVARTAFGDSTARRRSLPDDPQLRRALELARSATAQRDLFAAADRDARPVAKVAPRVTPRSN